MRRMLRPCLLALTLVSLNSAGQLAAQSNGGPWKVGQPAPHLHLPTIGSSAANEAGPGAGSLKLSDFLGQRVLLIEFASW